MVNQADKMGSTALCKSVFRDHIEMVKLLLEHGADPNHTNRNGETPLFYTLHNRPKQQPCVIFVLVTQKMESL